jgi:16S rRNA (guanine527-N7)-methyltransferase
MNSTEQIEHYLRLLSKWSRAYNLTAIRDLEKMRTHHILDSLSIEPYLPSGSLLDLGSGAGLPGIPLAIQDPARTIVMVDSNRKKSSFIQQAILELGLGNATAIHSRAEEYRPAKKFNIVVSRAFTSLQQFLQLSLNLVESGGVAVAMKGKWPEEDSAIVDGFELERVEKIEIPELNAERHLIVCARV